VHRRDDPAFFMDRAGDGHGAGGVGADVRVMGAVDHKGKELTVGEERRDDGHVRQVGPPQEGVVEDHQVPFIPRYPGDHGGHREGHAAQVDGDVGRLGAEPAGTVEYGAGEIEPVADIGREGGVAQHRAHFVTDGLEPTGEQAEFYGIQ